MTLLMYEYICHSRVVTIKFMICTAPLKVVIAAVIVIIAHAISTVIRVIMSVTPSVITLSAVQIIGTRVGIIIVS